MAEVICFSNFKGGSGKTSTCLGVYSVLTHEYQKKVLLIDVDAQCNSTKTMGANTSNGRNVGGLMIKANTIQEVIQKTNYGYIIPAHFSLNKIEVAIDEIGREYCLSTPIQEVADEFDYILIDCPPAMNICTIAALTASNKIIVPVRAEIFSLDGLDELFHNIIQVKAHYNPSLNVDGILLNQYDQQKVSYKEVSKSFKAIAEMHDSRVYNTYIRQNIAIAEAQLLRRLLHDYDIKSHGYEDYCNLVKEIIG